MVAAHQPMDTSNSIMKRDIHSNSIAAAVGEIDTGFSARAHHPRSIFQKREVCDRCVNAHSHRSIHVLNPLPAHSSSSNICEQKGFIIYCCASDYTCFYDNGWRCDPNVLGLTRGQKIGIGIGVTVAFFVLCIIGFVIFFCCCRKVVQVASGAISGQNNNNNQGVYPPQQPVMYYDPAPTQVGGEGKPYTDNAGYYVPPPQQGGKSDISWLFCRGGGVES